MAQHFVPATREDIITASGGFCAPLTVAYDIQCLNPWVLNDDPLGDLDFNALVLPRLAVLARRARLARHRVHELRRRLCAAARLVRDGGSVITGDDWLDEDDQ